MDITSILNTLNEAQRKAVSSDNKHTLVLAGAGSGKTRVLVHRIAWHIHVHGFTPSQIMAVTFTNKAAAEMKARIETTIQHRITGMLMGTFHSISHQLLRTHHAALNLSPHFTILDSDDMLRTIKKTLKELNLDESRFQPKMLQNLISQAKENRVTAQQMPDGNLYQKQLKNIYIQYEKLCTENAWLDFTDLLLKTITLLTNHSEVRQAIHQRIQAVLVDEFQDINALQYAWLEAFYHDKLYSLCVGDDDQSIYSWRGARADLMTHYAQNYPNVLTVRLEQNYRSTPVILEAANHVIANNRHRMGKTLWTDEQSGELIDIFQAYSDTDEAKYVIENATKEINNGTNASKIAILYRSNAQSRIFEEQCHAQGLTYRIYAGQRFFDRQEIKDTLAYFRMAMFPGDTAALERIINTPNRGIGHSSIGVLRDIAIENNTTLWEAISIRIRMQPQHKLSKALLQFQEDINWMRELKNSLKTRDLAEAILERSQLIPHIQRTEKEHENKCENIRELLEAIDQFCHNDENTFESFIHHVALMHADDNQKSQDAIQLMTLHAAKGLEFDIVFLVGLEEELLPHKASMGEKNGLEEERRLCYVGMTRARKKLIISHAESRRLYGQSTYQMPSRFINEIPPHCIAHVRPNFVHAPTSTKIYKVGQIVKHPKHGEGQILTVEGESPHTRMHVQFNTVGAKWFLCDYCDLERL